MGKENSMTKPHQPEREMTDEQWAEEYAAYHTPDGAAWNDARRNKRAAYLAGLAKGRALEREACAKLADEYGKKHGDDRTYISNVTDKIAAAKERIAELEADCERERMRLAACGTAALGYFKDCADEYRSASLEDVLRLRSKRMHLEAQLAQAEQRIKELENERK